MDIEPRVLLPQVIPVPVIGERPSDRMTPSRADTIGTLLGLKPLHGFVRVAK